MKRCFILLMLVSLFSTCMYAFYPAYVNRGNGDGPYPLAVMAITHDDTNIYVARLDGHLVVINKASGEKTILDVKVGSLSYAPWAITVHEGKVWIGTAETEGKILYYSNGQFHQSGIKLDWEYSRYGVPGIHNIMFDTQGNMYVSCSYGVGFKVDTKNNTESFTIHPKALSLFSGHICLDRSGALWGANYGFSGYDYTLAKYTKAKGTEYYFKEHKDAIRGAVTALAMDEEGCIWYTANNKLVRLINGEMSVSYDCPYICYDMQFDSQQRLWMADQYGPLRMMENGVFTSYPCPFESKRWMCMDIDGDEIYIGTDEFLLLFKDGEYTKIDLGQPDPQGHKPTGINHTESSPSTFGIFDLQGRRLQDKPERGMYIQDGRKVVIK